MASAIKFPVIDADAIVGVDGIFGSRERGRAFVDLVRGDIARIDDANARLAGFRLPMKTFIDGVESANLYRATDRSEITARWELGVGAVAFVWDLVHSSGPSKSGAYRASARLYADGHSIASPQDAAGAREVLILPTVPYARKIERGRNGYAPGKVYEAIVAAARARFSNVVWMKFTYAEPEGPAPGLDAWAAAQARRAFFRPVRNYKQRMALDRQSSHRSKDRRQPAILILLG